MFLSSYAIQQCIYCTYPSIPLAEINVIYALIVHGLVVYRNICRKYEALLVSWHSTVIKDAINERKARLGAHILLVLNQSHQHHCTITNQYKLWKSTVKLWWKWIECTENWGRKTQGGEQLLFFFFEMYLRYHRCARIFNNVNWKVHVLIWIGRFDFLLDCG